MPPVPKPNPRAVAGGNKGPKLDLEADGRAGKQIPKDRLAAISRKGDELAKIDADIAALNDRLDGLGMRKTVIETKELPELMEGYATALTLPSGQQIELKEHVVVRMPTEDEPERRTKAFEYVGKIAPDIIKRLLSVAFDKGEEAKADQLKRMLTKFKYNFSDKPDVHWKTLQGFVVEQIEQGAKIKLDLFNYFSAKKATLVAAKKPRVKK